MLIKSMKKAWQQTAYTFAIISILVILGGLYVAPSSNKQQLPPQVSQGKLDLTTWLFSQDNLVNLDGDWNFYWNKLLSPIDLNANSNALIPINVKVPGYWDNYTLNNQPLTNKGHGTFTLSIKGLKAQEYGLLIPTTYTANKIWINNKLVAQSGVVGVNAEETHARWQSHEVFFTPNKTTTQLTIQMATYDHPHFDGGITRAITLGTAAQIHALSMQRSLIDWTVVCVFLMLAFYQFVVFWHRRQDKVPLYFTLVSVLIAGGALLTRNSFLNLDLIDIDFSIYQRLIYLCQSFIAILFLKYIQGSFPHHCNHKIVNFLLYLSVTYFISMLILTPNEPAIARHIFSIIMALTISYGLFCIAKAAFYKEKSAGVFLLGFLFITFCFLLEILIANDIIHPISSYKDGPSSIGLIVFMLSQTYILARRHSRTLQERLSYELANSAKDRFLSAASHDLRQPIFSLQLMSEFLSKQPENSKISQMIEKNTQYMESLVNNILEISRLDQDALKPKPTSFSVEEFLGTLEQSYRIKAESKGLKFSVISSSLSGYSDTALLSRIVGNLLSNAIRYTDKGRVILGCRRVNGLIAICVYDSGCGIPQNKQQAIFQEFYQLDNQENKIDNGLGLGLSIVKRLANILKHSVKLSSKENTGSQFSVIIPRAN